MTVATKSITAEELFSMGDLGRCELIKGEVIRMAPAGEEHGGVTMELAFIITSYVKQKALGKVYAAETGFLISRNPDTVRAPDVAVVSKSRVPKARQGYFDGAPDLVVEVVSPNDSHSELLAKVNEWLAAGAQSVWTVDPQNKSIEVYRPAQPVLRYFERDQLCDEPALPGFALRISDLFRSR